MAEIGIIASVAQIADLGLRLSIKLYTFGEIVASADRSVISLSKDVSLTSGVLKELGQILDKDRETQTFSDNAVQTAGGLVKECLQVFQEMEDILVKKLPNLGSGGKGGRGGGRVKRAAVILERLKWGYLQPKLQFLRSNLDRLKSTLLLMLNVITYARQVSEKAESPSVIAEQKSLIEDLAHSNEEYIRIFEGLKLGIGGPMVENVDSTSNIGAVTREPSTTTRLLPKSPSKRIRFAPGGAPLQTREENRSLSSKDLTTATWSSPHARNHTTRSLATPLTSNNNIDVFVNTSLRTNTAMPPVQEGGIPTMETPVGSDQETLLKQLDDYSMLINNLLKEVDEAQYKITSNSRVRMKGSIANLYEGERQELKKTWGCNALLSAEQRLDSLREGLGELPRWNRFAARDPVKVVSPNDVRREVLSSLPKSHEPHSREQEEAAAWMPSNTGLSAPTPQKLLPSVAYTPASSSSSEWWHPGEGEAEETENKESYRRGRRSRRGRRGRPRHSINSLTMVPVDSNKARNEFDLYDLALSCQELAIGKSTMKDPSDGPVSANEAASTPREIIGVRADGQSLAGIIPAMTLSAPNHLAPQQQDTVPKAKNPPSPAHNPPQQQLSAATLQSQRKAFNKARATNLQKIQVNNSNRAPAAPTTSHAPFSYSSQSPQSTPQIYRPTKNKLTQEKLVLPVAKKIKGIKKIKGNYVASPSTPAQASVPLAGYNLSPFQKTGSPDAPRPSVMTSMIKCPMANCKTAGFLTKADLETHISDAHEPKETRHQAAVPIGKPDPGMNETKQGDSHLSDVGIVDHLVFLWTTVKPSSGWQGT